MNEFLRGGETATSGVARSLVERELETLYHVSQVLSRSLDFRETLSQVLQVLDENSDMHHGLISLLDASTGDLLVTALHQGWPSA